MTTDKAWAPIPNDLFRLGWSKTKLLVYVTLLCAPYGRHGVIVLSQPEIAAGSGVSIRTVRSAIPDLVADGVIVHQQLYDGIPAYYQVNELPRDGGFFKLPRRWLWDAPLTTTEKIVYLVLLSRRNRNTGEAIVAWFILISEARIRTGDLAPAMERLEALGLVVRRRQSRAGKRQGVNRYKVSLPSAWDSTPC